MGYVSRHDHALLDFRLSLPKEWARDEPRRRACHVPEDVSYRTRHAQCLQMLDLWSAQVPHGWVTGDDELGRHTQFRQQLCERGERYVLGVPCTPVSRYLEAPCLSRARTATEAAVAVGDGLAPHPRPGCMGPRDGARRRERTGGHRDRPVMQPP